MKKKPKPRRDKEMLDEYDFSQGVRGKFAKRFAKGTNVVVILPELAEYFPDSRSVNKALKNLVEIAHKNVKHSTQ